MRLVTRAILGAAALIGAAWGTAAGQSGPQLPVVTTALVETLEPLQEQGQLESITADPRLFDPACDAKSGLVYKQSLPGATPKPSPETIKDYSQFIDRTVGPENVLDLHVGIPKLLVFKTAPKRIQVADEDRNAVLAFTVISPTELSIAGKKAGVSVLNLWFADPADGAKERILSYMVRVHPDLEAAELVRQQDLLSRDLARKHAAEAQQAYYRQMQLAINKAFPDSFVCLNVIGDSLLVTGQARDAQEAVQILRIIQPLRSGIGGGSQSGGILLTEHGIAASRQVVVPPAPVEGDQPQPPTDKQPAKDGGESKDTEASAVTRPFGLRLVNQLRIPGEQQVALKVVVAEINRTAARSIGVNWSISDAAGITVFSNNTGAIGAAGAVGSGSTVASSLANIQALINAGKVHVAINALRTMNLAKSLAEPTLVALNGQTARFQSGGEFPVPVVTGFTAAGLQGVQFVPFGVQMSFTPAITERNRIRLAVTADVSTRDVQTGTTINGSSVPGLNTRNVQTVVELREGQTLAVAGLLQTNFGSDGTRVPFFGDLPVIGRLAAFDHTSAGEQELVILVTPVLVHPLAPHEVPPLPGSDTFEPSDVEFYLLGRLESNCPADWRSPVRTDFERQCIQQRVESQLIIGPSGHSDGKH